MLVGEVSVLGSHCMLLGVNGLWVVPLLVRV